MIETNNYAGQQRQKAMPKLLDYHPRDSFETDDRKRAPWPATLLGFIGSAIITWLAVRSGAPMAAEAWGIPWLDSTWCKVMITGLIGAGLAYVLSRIDGTIWGTYFVIIGYMLSFVLLILIALHLLNVI